MNKPEWCTCDAAHIILDVDDPKWNRAGCAYHSDYGYEMRELLMRWVETANNLAQKLAKHE